jgi:hypothetical protein
MSDAFYEKEGSLRAVLRKLTTGLEPTGAMASLFHMLDIIEYPRAITKKLGETRQRVLIVDGDKEAAEGKRVAGYGRVLSCVQPSGEDLCVVIICHQLHR